MTMATVARPVIRPLVEFPADPALDELPKLFDADWVWHEYQTRYGEQEYAPETMRFRQFSHSSGRVAMASYLMEYGRETYLSSEHLTIKTERGVGTDLYRYPEDDRLPALSDVAEPETALKLVNKYVLAMRPRRVRVQLVRYRPRSRAVFRYSVGRVKLYARVVRPRVVNGMLEAHRLIGRSEFAVPRLVGCWEEGGVLWLSEIPGKNLRGQILKGRMPATGPLLDGLESLWNQPMTPESGQPFDLYRAYRTARRTFKNKIGDDDDARGEYDRAIEMLDPFVRSWRPTRIAHNDFYDDQMIEMGDGRIALVDFEEAGPGDPMLDVGNCLGHLKWAAKFGRSRRNASGRFYEVLKSDALQRFGWDADELALREAVCLFRTCTNAIRRPKADWRRNLVEGLSLVNETLGLSV